jgi:hypothetical protein
MKDSEWAFLSSYCPLCKSSMITWMHCISKTIKKIFMNNHQKKGEKKNSKNGKHQKNQFKFMASETSNQT